MLGRSFSSTSYRYGFNGKEDDYESGWQDYGMRMYNPKLARFFRVDPITRRYPTLSPYQFAGNTPISSIDLDGLEAFIHTFIRTGDNKSELIMVNQEELFEVDQNHIRRNYHGDLGRGHLYVYLDDGKITTIYKDKLYTGNLFGTAYVGPDNPMNSDGSFNYDQAPINELDYAGYKHDKGYDAWNAVGSDDADWNLSVLDIDKKLVSDCEEVIRKYNQYSTKGEKDEISGNRVSFDEKNGAWLTKEYFQKIVDAKTKVMNEINQDYESDRNKHSDGSYILSKQEILNNYNKVHGTKYKFADKDPQSKNPSKNNNKSKKSPSETSNPRFR